MDVEEIKTKLTEIIQYFFNENLDKYSMYANKAKELIESQQQEIERLKANKWINVDNEKPTNDKSEYYGDRHSIPVIIYNQYEKPVLVRWDYYSGGWVNSNFNEGCSAVDYDYEGINNWQPLPNKPQEA